MELQQQHERETRHLNLDCSDYEEKLLDVNEYTPESLLQDIS